MSGKLVLRLTGCFLMIFSFACSAPKESKEPTLPPVNTAVPEQKPAEIRIYDISKEDIIKIPGITSRNISVEGVKLGDRTRDVDKILGNPIKTETLPLVYRSAYRDHGLYLEFDRYTGKVKAIYVNNLYKNIKGELAVLMAGGKLELMKRAFGDNPIETHPEPKITMYEYPSKGIQFIHQDQLEVGSHTLKLVEPKGN
jgi:hypothetical protein